MPVSGAGGSLKLLVTMGRLWSWLSRGAFALCCWLGKRSLVLVSLSRLRSSEWFGAFGGLWKCFANERDGPPALEIHALVGSLSNKRKGIAELKGPQKEH